jgi:hypothetical protein
LKPERWESPLFQEKYQACGKRQHSIVVVVVVVVVAVAVAVVGAVAVVVVVIIIIEMWNKTYVIIPVITGATGIVT